TRDSRASPPPEALMKKLGTIKDFSYRGDLVVRATFAPPPGARVRDRRKQTLGRVVRVFGPVRAPYVTVKPTKQPKLRLLGSGVYVEEPK
ncbi:MAG: H/ACA ribonucleoprotein complex subunit GAR1, partial [Thermoplasmata archaeon]